MPGPMNGKTCVITGASSGIGLETARQLAGLGAHVVLVGRNPQRIDLAITSIRRDLPHARLDRVISDLSLLENVRALPSALPDPIHVLVNNAAVVPPQRRETVEGIEEQLAVNHLAPFLLTLLLEDRLVASAPARVVDTCSESHHYARRIDWDDIQARRAYSRLGMGQYAVTKLLMILTARRFAKRLDARGVTVNCAHPGAVATNIWPGWMRPAMKLVLRSPARGARTLTWLASDPALQDVTGGYFEDEKPALRSEAAENPAFEERAWAASVALCGLGNA